LFEISATHGVTSYAELTPRHIAAAPPVTEPGALSAFPLLGEPTGTAAS
jgi:hypothetical protein